MKLKGKFLTREGETPFEIELEAQSHPRKRPDAIAIAAIFISMLSLITSAVSNWQTRIHDRLSVIPDLDVGSYQELDDAGIAVTNNGVGPAVVKVVDVWFNRKKLTDFFELYRTLSKDIPPSDIWYGNFGDSNPMLPPGKSFAVLRATRLTKEERNTIWTDIKKKIEVRVVYCSVYGECWTTCLNSSDAVCPNIN